MNSRILLTIALVIALSTTLLAQRTFNKDNAKTINGTITSVNHPVAYFTADDGTKYELRMGPYWFWQQNNLKLDLSSATVKGETGVDNGVNEIYPWDIMQNNTTISLVDENGYPKWSNGNNGNGRGRGNCWRNGNNNDNNGRGRGNCWRNGNNNDNNGWGRNPNCPYRNNK